MTSQARAAFRSRMTVCGYTLRASAASSALTPQEKLGGEIHALESSDVTLRERQVRVERDDWRGLVSTTKGQQAAVCAVQELARLRRDSLRLHS
jgi:hypothetical protein